MSSDGWEAAGREQGDAQEGRGQLGSPAGSGCLLGQLLFCLLGSPGLRLSVPGQVCCPQGSGLPASVFPTLTGAVPAVC